MKPVRVAFLAGQRDWDWLVLLTGLAVIAATVVVWP